MSFTNKIHGTHKGEFEHISEDIVKEFIGDLSLDIQAINFYITTQRDYVIVPEERARLHIEVLYHNFDKGSWKSYLSYNVSEVEAFIRDIKINKILQ